MADSVGRVVVVTGPRMLPEGFRASQVASLLSKESSCVLMFQSGDDKYVFDRDYLIPSNVHVITYEYETWDETVDSLRGILRPLGIDFVGRDDRLPFVLAGSIMRVPDKLDVSVYGAGKEAKQSVMEPTKSVAATVSSPGWYISG